MVNVTFFTLASIIGIELEHARRHAEAATMAVVTLLALIVCGEMVPKTIGVQFPRFLAGLVGLPVAFVARTLDPLMPFFTAANRLLGRIVAPNFVREPYLEISDLERAITLYRRAADQNNAVGINNVGYFYEFGRAVALDLNQAAQWYERAVRLGDKSATGNLGRVQEKLRNVPVRR